MLLLMVLKENFNILEGVVSLPISKKRVPYILFTSSMIGLVNRDLIFFLFVNCDMIFFLFVNCDMIFFFICEL